MLGHIRQAKDDFIFNQPRHIEARRPDYALDDFIGISLMIVFELKIGLGSDQLHTIFRFHLKRKSLHAALALKYRTSPHCNPQKILSVRVFFARYSPFGLRIALLRQPIKKPRKLYYRRGTANRITQTG